MLRFPSWWMLMNAEKIPRCKCSFRSSSYRERRKCGSAQEFDLAHRSVLRGKAAVIKTEKKNRQQWKRKLFINARFRRLFFFFWFCEKKRNRAFAKNREREKTPSTEWKKKDGQSRGARTCMYDFIRPKMETYLFPAKWRWPEIRVFFSFDAAFFSLFFNFVLELAVFLLPSLSYRTRERARQRNTRKKKHQKCTKNSNDLKCFAGQVLAVHTRGWSNGSKIY